ncbi:MAG: hypothetical protein DYH17_15300 [Xanthomonadales bacterium PRO6]|nr:hypothetical protein [Xanthomonadales bacterium PRO6]
MPKVDLAFRLLCDWLTIGAPPLHPAVLTDVDTGVGYRHLLDLGLAKPESRLLEDITCPWCSTGTLHQVCLVRGGSGGNAYRGLCLSCGWQNIPAAQLSPLILDLPKIARAVAAALGLASRFETQEIVPGKLWRIGEREVARKRHRVWFAPVVDECAARALSGEAGIMVCVDAPASRPPAMAKLAAVPLRSCAHLRKAGLVIEDFEAYVGCVSTREIGTSLASLDQRAVHINGERVAISPQVQRFLKVLVAADGKPVHKSAIADALEIDVDKFSPHQIFRQHKSVKEVFVDADGAGRYWLASVCGHRT